MQVAAYNSGTVFKLSASGKFTTLYSFCSQQNCTDGELPYSGLVLSSDGNFYGTTVYGGAYDFCAGLGCGTVFEITPAGELTTLRSFCPKKSCFGGANPGPGVVLGSDGNLYGTTESGGTECTNGNPSGGCGTIFRITPSGEFASLHSFDSTDGSSPRARLVQGRDGKFYGSTFLGGNSGGCVSGCGTVFSLAAVIRWAAQTQPRGPRKHCIQIRWKRHAIAILLSRGLAAR